MGPRRAPGAANPRSVRFVQPFGNGTTAIYAALRALGCRDRPVMLPANICPSVISAIYRSSNIPFFVDIERERWGLDPEAVAREVAQAGAVIAVHMFGIPCHIGRIVAACEAHGVPVIEDCAQAEGALVDSLPVGSFGDIAVFSYGAGKIISAGGGGAASTRDAELFRALGSEHDALPEGSGDDVHAELGRAYKRLYNNNYPALPGEHRQEFDALLRSLAPRVLARHDASRDAIVAREHATLKLNVSERLRKAREYRRLLADLPGVGFIEFPEGSAPWRFNLLLEFEVRHKLLKEFLAAGANVSSWYPDISGFLPPGTFRAAPIANSVWLDKHVLNLWVDDATTDADIRATCVRVKEWLS